MRTVDGMEYNFNGIGEFFFIVSHNASFQSQVRFEQAKDSQGANNTYIWGSLVILTTYAHECDYKAL